MALSPDTPGRLLPRMLAAGTGVVSSWLLIGSIASTKSISSIVLVAIICSLAHGCEGVLSAAYPSSASNAAFIR